MTNKINESERQPVEQSANATKNSSPEEEVKKDIDEKNCVEDGLLQESGCFLCGKVKGKFKV